jgi:hypothetical protein
MNKESFLMSKKRSLSQNDPPLTGPCKRKRVSFATVPLSVHATDRAAESCTESWITKQAIVDTVRSHASTVQQAQVTEPNAYHLHGELLATTYTSSVWKGDSSFDAVQTPMTASLSCSHLLGMSSLSQLRGIEAFVLTSVSSDRMQRRRRHQSTMLKAQVKLSKHSQGERNSLMRQLSERLSASANAFAQAMGASDAVAAMMEHVSSYGSENNKTAPFDCKAPIQQQQSSQSTLVITSNSMTMNPSAAKRQCLPCKVVSPMA